MGAVRRSAAGFELKVQAEGLLRWLDKQDEGPRGRKLHLIVKEKVLDGSL